MEGYVPTGASERAKQIRDVSVGNSHVAENIEQPHRAPRPAPVVEHRSNYHDMKAKAAADQHAYPERERVRGAAAMIPNVHAGRAPSVQNDYESIVTRFAFLAILS